MKEPRLTKHSPMIRDGSNVHTWTSIEDQKQTTRAYLRLRGEIASKPPKNRKARVLVLHGKRQSSFSFLRTKGVVNIVHLGLGHSGPYMQIKTRFLTSALEKAFPVLPDSEFNASFPDGFELFYPTAPTQLKRADTDGKMKTTDSDAWAWGYGDYASEEIKHLDIGMQRLLRILRDDGPFEGVIGFSSGATVAMILLSLAERGASPEVMETLKLDADVSCPLGSRN